MRTQPTPVQYPGHLARGAPMQSGLPSFTYQSPTAAQPPGSDYVSPTIQQPQGVGHLMPDHQPRRPRSAEYAFEHARYAEPAYMPPRLADANLLLQSRMYQPTPVRQAAPVNQAAPQDRVNKRERDRDSPPVKQDDRLKRRKPDNG